MARKRKAEASVDVPRTQEARVLRSRSVLNVSDDVQTPPTTPVAIVEDSYQEEDIAKQPVQSSPAQSASSGLSESRSVSAVRELPAKTSRAQIESKAPATEGQRTRAQQPASSNETNGKLSAVSTLNVLRIQRADKERKSKAYAENTRAESTLSVDPQPRQEDAMSIASQESSTEDEDEYQPSSHTTKKRKITTTQKNGGAKEPAVKRSRATGKKTRAQPNATQKKTAKTATKPIRKAPKPPVNVTPPSAQQARRDMVAASQLLDNKDDTDQTPLLQRKQDTAVPLVDDEKSRKTTIISFGKNGPLNQGRSSAARSPVPRSEASRAADQAPACSGEASECPKMDTSKTTKKMTADTKSIKPTGKQQLAVSTANPLAGYARFLPKTGPQALPQSPQEPGSDSPEEVAQVVADGEADAPAADHYLEPQQDDEIFDEAASPPHMASEAIDDEPNQDHLEAQMATDQQPTTSQLAMPPPPRATKSKIETSNTAAPVAVMRSSHAEEITMLSSVETSPALNISGPSDGADAEPEDNDSSMLRETDAQSSTAQPPTQVIDKDAHGQLDDSGYVSATTMLSAIAQTAVRQIQVHKHGSPQVAPCPKISKAISPDLSPVKAIRRNNKQAVADKSEDVEHEGHEDTHNQVNPFQQRPLEKLCVHPHELLLHRGTFREQSSESGATDAKSEDEIPVKSSSEAPEPSSSIDSTSSDIPPLKDLDQMLTWRDTLRPHQLSLFDLLINDSYQLVAQLARREGRLQNKIASFREKGLRLVDELDSSYARDRQHSRSHRQ